MPENFADLSPELLAYFATREQQRQDKIAEAWPQLQIDVAGFITRFGHLRDDPNFATCLAKLIREATVAGFVRGAMYGQYQKSLLQMPTDDVMLFQARETTQSMSDLYPAWALVDGRSGEGEDDG